MTIEALGAQPVASDIEGLAFESALSEAVRVALQSAKTDIKYAALAVSGPAVFTRTLLVPKGQSDADIQNWIAQATDRYMPYPLTEAALDFTLLEGPADQPDQAKLMLVACWLPYLEKRRAALQAAGLQVVIADVESLVLRRAFAWMAGQLPERPATAVLYLGEYEAFFLVLADHNLVFADEKPLTAETFLPSKSDQLWPAEQETKQPFLDAMTTAPLQEAECRQLDSELLSWVLEQMELSEVRDGGRIAQILLAGAKVSPALKESLQMHLDIPVIEACALSHFPISDAVDKDLLIDQSANLMVACGLALRGYNNRH